MALTFLILKSYYSSIGIGQICDKKSNVSFSQNMCMVFDSDENFGLKFWDENFDSE